jgi:hypothetical protein
MRREYGRLAVVAAIALAGCATARAPLVTADAPVIRYATAACFGTCPVYDVTVRPDGRVTFVGERFTAVTGTREVAATPETYRRVAAAIALYRPAGERLVVPGSVDCANPPTDMPSVDLWWHDRAGERHLRFYRGCRRGNEALAAALDAVPAALPIARLIGR